jgi:hypothetical protein
VADVVKDIIENIIKFKNIIQVLFSIILELFGKMYIWPTSAIEQMLTSLKPA